MSTGKLLIVGTPIGNLEDITLRALRTLREADCVAAEDTRHTGQLLTKYEIRKPLVSYLEKLRTGQRIALVSDAGMPTLSDPGLRLIAAVVEAGLPVETVPGISAITTALAGSGLPAQPFLFHGFLPHKSAQREKILQRLAPLPCALVFFESPYRLIKTLTALQTIIGDRRVVVARELTKKFEEILRGTPATLLKRLENRAIKGEITLIIEALKT